MPIINVYQIELHGRKIVKNESVSELHSEQLPRVGVLEKRTMTKEEERLEQSREHQVHWKRWGPYVSERAWGTVREDYSEDGSAWGYFPHDQARFRAYRWNEDGIAAICDRHQYICFGLALWNGKDEILKERLYGVSGWEGNHGEDVKEYYYYLDNTPTHSYMKFMYKYPHAAFPYRKLAEENRKRNSFQPEYELMDTGVFDEDRYFDVTVEYAKNTAEDVLIQITGKNHGPDPSELHLLPSLWFRNTWSWGGDAVKPLMGRVKGTPSGEFIEVNEPHYGQRWLACEGTPELLFTENQTNDKLLLGKANSSKYVKDGINDYVTKGVLKAVNPEQSGTKSAAHYRKVLAPGESWTIRLRFTDSESSVDDVDAVGDDFDQVFAQRRAEADEFYTTIIPENLSADANSVMRQACAGMLWSKQFYHYVVEDWLNGDPVAPPPASSRMHGRNNEWRHLHNADVISMPDKWEYPWYAAWDLAFHCIPLSLLDSDFAKEQLALMLREWYMHPSGALPAYEWSFSDVNPPVHAWAALRVFKIEEKRRGVGDVDFLERIFHKLLLNFTWWINRKDAEGMSIFQGGFLGLDNIGVFDRSAALPTGGFLEQSDGTSWMGMYTLNLLAIAMELAKYNPVYEDVASKFWEHFLYIAQAMTKLGPDGVSLWDETDGFFYDVLHLPDGVRQPLKVRSMVGLIPLFAIETLESEMLDRIPGFKRRMEWFIQNRKDLTQNIARMEEIGRGERRLLSIVGRDKLARILSIMLDENEFLSPYGIRSVSRKHKDSPFTFQVNGHEHRVDYEPAESASNLFGGNSNWRGPIWFPLNYLLIESLQKFHYYFGDDFKVEFPTGSGVMMNLWDVAGELSRRLTRIFLDNDGSRPVYGKSKRFQTDPNWNDKVLFYEYFNGDTGEGIGASHQTGWTGLVIKLMQQSGT